ncbi:glycine/sarcosine/betaine reductase component B alpha/beta subunit [Desulfosporosinus orientis DSM 765]|uniref:Glycine/sarcosine/betaine reductase component B alpha/beta subunit n=1 Tax=Desulfosporosinus orientis (strain ATCC 19365 / DSM 765 / NCIMB 8382 / VKM B-1628 / Singapore I) TaxID=768706 RepID=G7WBH6_DESOD|nr:glycine/sarcosine/betaine reductase component B subunit [Desulfosporosinus orientis]AET68305.1 glycine/sarcosine/betaine reductase component B alpha/beta subunit [Desulfosporosinus orientis DSM 765]
MKLEIGRIYIHDIQLGGETSLEDGVLTIDQEGLISKLKEDERIKEVHLDVAKPGEKIRIIPVKDVIEPRVKVEGGQNGFPGVTSKQAQCGEGRTHVLYGAAVVTVGDIVGFQEGVVDMWGEGAKWTPFSRTLNLTVDIKAADGLDPHTHEETVRMAGLRAAEYIGLAGKDAVPDEILTFEMGSVFEEAAKYPDLPKVLYAEMNITQGLLHDTYIYGVNEAGILPALLHANEELDNAVISGNCVAACDKITTYQHQNNSVIYDLYAQHGKEINFLGVIMVPEHTTLAGKLRASDYTVKLAKMLGADAVVVSEEGYGNPDSDLLMICKKCEKSGIKTVLITDECAGRDGMSQPLADTAAEAVAVVSGGNVSHVVTLEPADKVIGSLEAIAVLAGGWEGSSQEDGSFMCELNAVIGATSEIGFHNVTCRLY